MSVAEEAARLLAARRTGQEERAVRFGHLAQQLGVTPQAVTELRHVGKLVLTDDGRRALYFASLAQIVASADPSKTGVAARHDAAKASGGGYPAGEGSAAAPEAPQADTPASGSTSGYQAARAVKERYLAMEAKRAYEAAIGKLMDGAQVESAVAAGMSALRARLGTLTSTLAPQLAPITDEAAIRQLLEESFDHALSELARQFTHLSQKGTTA